jgi:hypothetical protein
VAVTVAIIDTCVGVNVGVKVGIKEASFVIVGVLTIAVFVLSVVGITVYSSVASIVDVPHNGPQADNEKMLNINTIRKELCLDEFIMYFIKCDYTSLGIGLSLNVNLIYRIISVVCFNNLTISCKKAIVFNT